LSAPVRVLIRADAGASIGTGHFARASALAQALRLGAGADIVLATDEDGAALVSAFFGPEVDVLALSAGADDPAAVLSGLRARAWTPDVVALDQYGQVTAWEEAAARAGIALLVFDDLDAASRADVIVRPHGGPADEGDAVVLRGPVWLPLSPEIVRLAAAVPEEQGARLRLNVCFGGSDPTGETAKALDAAAELQDLDIDVVIGPGAHVEPALIERAARLPHVTLHRAPSQAGLARLVAGADLALGAGGVMLWERMCLGVPSLVVCAADNQRPQIDSMVAAGAIRFLGDHADITAADMARGIAALASDQAAREAIAKAGQALVDGRGALRLAAWIRALSLGLRDVRIEDAADLLKWRTDDRNWLHNWEASAKPTLAEHMAWLTRKLADPACVLRIILCGPEPVGVVRFDLDEAGEAASLSIYLVPEWQGRGMGLPVYFAAERALRRSRPGVRRIDSRIHQDNAASRRLHTDAGFALRPSGERTDWLEASKSLD
jgi:spore coat polysaccharide biosynthesis predicted glycosyltransferase SpsG/RimJ/RimL family protein N-acetyltransferase